MWLFLFVGLVLVATAYFAVSAAVAPNLAARGRARMATRPWGAVLLGLGVSVPWFVVGLLLLQAPPAGAKLAGALLLMLWVLCGLLGGAGIAQHIGGASESAAWTHTVRGGLLISLTWILPFVGWFIALPLTMAAGVGCVLLGVFGRKQELAAAAF
jgi:hypothetical protein